MSYYRKTPYNNYTPFKKPKTVGFDDSEAEEVNTEEELSDIEENEEDEIEYIVDQLDKLNNKLDDILQLVKGLSKQ